jgi:hypothetical protein
LRRTFFHSLSRRAGRKKTTKTFDRFVSAVRAGLRAPD